ncbi:hypothetical protein V2J09_018043 [Rumex salicifolius]
MNRQDPGAANRGKHRILAELKRLEQETCFLEVVSSLFILVAKCLEELDQLNKMEKVSANCKDLERSVEAKPDALLAE